MGKILILEDEESLNRGISCLLDKAAHETCSCFTIAEGMKQTILFQPDVIICDLNLTDGSGLDFISWARKRTQAYMICLTARGQEMDQVLGYEAGVDDYVTKPFSLSVFLLKIEAFFKRSAKEPDADWVYSGRLRVNRKEMKLSADGKEISLLKNKWKLLCLFLDHPKQVLSKQQILERVFDAQEAYIDENTLAVNIRRLREKIEDVPAQPVYIKNIRGLGCVWDMEADLKGM